MHAAQHYEQYECDHIHEPVPANGNGPKRKGDGVELGVGEHVDPQENGKAIIALQLLGTAHTR